MKMNVALRPTRVQSRRKFMTDLVSERTLTPKFSTWITTKVIEFLESKFLVLMNVNFWKVVVVLWQ